MKIAIIGLGNPIVGDDAVGIRVLDYIKENKTLPSFVDIMVDVSLSGIGLVELFRGYDKVIIIDSMQSNQFEPGTVLRLNPDQFVSALHVSDYHNMDFFTAYEFGKEIYDDLPPNEQIVILGIEINYITEFSDQLSPEIKSKFDDIVNDVYQFIKKEINQEKEIIRNVL
ncbi:MAG: hydrogenase maturation protease [Candidatus Heimdallarchaeum aukensis]|uniref:Hydrogenase maturation protease n=1 Tax=Candidatus Heimdallarchaeum aukensis TaxID=2876573 RepID=A0A9Y1BKH9_9ARCH|nr:MAG: hydrogenase maturation protease [Candidatus Heimdallarchaeum aukensis]